MIRYLTERLPVMICPQWVYRRVQPISIGNVLDYLIETLQIPESVDRIIEIGGADILTYAEMMMGYARVRGLKRWLIPVPVLTPKLSSYWVHLITPIPANIAQPLIGGLRNEVIVREESAKALFPRIHLEDYESAVQTALEKLQAGQVETAWSDALCSTQGDIPPVILSTQEGMILEQRQVLLEITSDTVYRAFSSLGGEQGWLYLNWAWKLRGIVDRLVGGVGIRRGRRDPIHLRAGEAIDFWRVEAVEPGVLMRLRAEMKVPGLAWLQFQAVPQSEGGTLLAQTAFFAPKGLLGWIYWYALYPIHALVFSGLIRKITERAKRLAEESSI